jgi:hypothetical protein
MQTGSKHVTIEQQGANWVVLVGDAQTGKRFYCATERMAKTFAAMFERTLNPLSKAA